MPKSNTLRMGLTLPASKFCTTGMFISHWPGKTTSCPGSRAGRWKQAESDWSMGSKYLWSTTSTDCMAALMAAAPAEDRVLVRLSFQLNTVRLRAK